MPSTREIRRRIKSIKGIRQITKAMHMVAAVKMRKAQRAALASRTYAQLAWRMLNRLSEQGRVLYPSPLLDQRPVRQAAVLVVASNRGLAGSLNENVLREALRVVQALTQDGVAVETVLLGKRAAALRRRAGVPVAAEFEKADVVTSQAEVVPIAKLLIGDFISGRYDRVDVVYTDFRSAVNLKPVTRQLLPITREALRQAIEGATGDHLLDITRDEYLFEPDPAVVLAKLLPKFLELQLYQAVLEANASEHSARMVAMKNATDAAGDLLDDITLTYNQTRQAGITRELAEISSGMLALSE